MPGGAAAVVPRMPLRAAGPEAAAVLRIPGKGTKIFFAGKIRSRFSAGAGARTRPFPPGMPESCRLRVAPGRPIARRSSGPTRLRLRLRPRSPLPTPHSPRPTPHAPRLTPDAAPAPVPRLTPGSGPALRSPRPTPHRAARPRSVPHSRSALLSVPGPQPMPGALRTNAFFAVFGRKRFILGEFGNFVTFAPNFKPKQQWHINYSKVRKA